MATKVYAAPHTARATCLRLLIITAAVSPCSRYPSPLPARIVLPKLRKVSLAAFRELPRAKRARTGALNKRRYLDAFFVFPFPSFLPSWEFPVCADLAFNRQPFTEADKCEEVLSWNEMYIQKKREEKEEEEEEEARGYIYLLNIISQHYINSR